jgi:threonine dehydrogenase-like Zn-dependent dehydrogenase
MKAAVYNGPGQGLRVDEVPDPTPQKGQVVVRVERACVCGSDISLTRPRDRPTLYGPIVDALFVGGAVLGHEYGGEVIEVGPGVTSLQVGDRVAPMTFAGCGHCEECRSGIPQGCAQATSRMGGFAQFAAVYEHASVKLPERFSAVEGALVEPLATSLATASVAGVASAGRVLVLGAGALGLGVVHFAKHLGSARVAAVARTDAKAGVARRLGADAFLTQGPDLAAEATEALGGAPDVVIETAGVPGLIDQAILTVAPGGTVVSAGLSLDPEMTSHTIAAMKGLTLRYNAAYTLADFHQVVALLPGSGIAESGLVGAPVAFDAFPAAFEALQAGGAAHKVTLNPWL